MRRRGLARPGQGTRLMGEQVGGDRALLAELLQKVAGYVCEGEAGSSLPPRTVRPLGFGRSTRLVLA